MREVSVFSSLGLLLAFLPLLSAPSSGGREVLVELFTSEGCSSCPKADELLARLKKDPPQGSRVIALSEHVDYWDGGGWRDRFSSPVFTRRQEAYARGVLGRGVYTPQLVVSGHLEAVGSDERAARAAILSAAREPQGAIAARVEEGGGSPFLVVEAHWEGTAPAEVFLALVLDHERSQVAGGENAGRTLEHVAVVRSLSVIGSGVGSFQGKVRLGPPGPPSGGHLVLFVQERETSRVRAAAEIALP